MCILSVNRLNALITLVRVAIIRDERVRKRSWYQCIDNAKKDY